MMPDQWRRAEEIYHEALERSAGQRDVFVAEACAGDEVLRRKVMALMKAHKEASGFLERPAVEIAARTAIELPMERLLGQQISHYKIVSFIGRGGMGEVYL